MVQKRNEAGQLVLISRVPAKKVLRPGIEPGSSACEALVLTDIRTKRLCCSGNKYTNTQQIA